MDWRTGWEVLATSKLIDYAPNIGKKIIKQECQNPFILMLHYQYILTLRMTLKIPSSKPNQHCSVKPTSITPVWGAQFSCRQFSSPPEVSDLRWEFLKKPCLALKRCDVAADPILATNPRAASCAAVSAYLTGGSGKEGVGKEGKETRCPFSARPQSLDVLTYDSELWTAIN